MNVVLDMLSLRCIKVIPGKIDSRHLGTRSRVQKIDLGSRHRSESHDNMDKALKPQERLWVELCPLQIHMWKSQPAVCPNVTSFGDRVFMEVIKLKLDH